MNEFIKNLVKRRIRKVIEVDKRKNNHSKHTLSVRPGSRLPGVSLGLGSELKNDSAAGSTAGNKVL
jgi:hypothetical protein